MTLLDTFAVTAEGQALLAGPRTVDRAALFFQGAVTLLTDPAARTPANAVSNWTYATLEVLLQFRELSTCIELGNTTAPPHTRACIIH
jgi:hypothetical protein